MGFSDVWDSWGGPTVLVVILILFVIIIIVLAFKLDKPASGYSTHGAHGGQSSLRYSELENRHQSSAPTSKTGIDALVCGGPKATAAQNKAANALSGAALEKNLVGAMDDYMTSGEISYNTAIGSEYYAGTGYPTPTPPSSGSS